jgi:hypothetical protein
MFSGEVYRERYVTLGNSIRAQLLANPLWSQAFDVFLAETLEK